MSYISDTITDKFDISMIEVCWRNPELTKIVKEALKKGKTVQIRSSSFSDSYDWNEILINGKILHGSRKTGY